MVSFLACKFTFVIVIIRLFHSSNLFPISALLKEIKGNCVEYLVYCCMFFTNYHYWKHRAFAECKLLCRVSKIGHSAKNCTRQRVLYRVPGTRQKRVLDKGLLCRVLGSWQKLGTRHRLPRVMVFGHVLLCRVPAVRHSAKIFFNFVAECLSSGTRQRFIFLKMSLPSALLRHSAKRKFKKKFKTLFAECLIRGTRQRPPLPECHAPALDNFFYFWPPNFLCSPFKAPGTPS